MRALGLDVGTKTIGLALTDEAEVAAHPLGVLPRTGNVSDASAVAALCVTHGVTEVVVGMPFELSGRVGHRARRVLELVTTVRAALPPAVALHEHDERFSTAEAQRILLSGDVSRARRKQVIDQQAATVILQGWLDGHRRAK